MDTAMTSASRNDLPRILLAEDDPDARKLMAHMLRRIGEVVEAEDGERALALAERERPDLIITDVMMPGLDGFELAKLVRRSDRLRRIPIIVVTAKSTPKDVVEGINSGARHYLTKPFTQDELVDKVRRALQRPART
jgi:DNA-binding response OmpR family regulator